MSSLPAELQPAIQALAAGQPELAETWVRARLEASPDDADAVAFLGELALQAGRLAEAEAVLTVGIAKRPGHLPSRYLLALCLHRRARTQDALRHVLWLRRREPGDPRFKALEAAVRDAAGDGERSLRLYEEVLAKSPFDGRLSLSRSHLLNTLGRAAEAEAALRAQLASEAPGDVALRGEAWWSLANLKTDALQPLDLDRIRDALARNGLHDGGRVHLHYALGAGLECAGRFDEAFAAFSAGAAERRANIAHDPDVLTRQVDGWVAALNGDRLRARAGQGCPSNAPIFIVGLPRAGSTLVEQILASHPDVEPTQELPELPRLFNEAGLDLDRPERLLALSGAELQRLGEAYLERAQFYRRTRRSHFIDKLPENWINLAFIRLILPGATILDVRRHPLAAGMSAFRHLFARNHPWSYDLREIGRYYRDYLRYMHHLAVELPDPATTVIYENLVSSSEDEIRKILQASKLDFHLACLSPHETRRMIRTPSAAQVRRPISNAQRDHWRGYSQHLSALRDQVSGLERSWDQ